MEKGIFSEDIESTFVLQRHDGLRVNTNEFGSYWITSQANLTYERVALKDKEKCLCLQETIKLNRQGLLPFWTMNGDSTEEVKGNPSVVIRSIESFRNTKIAHQDKELAIIHLLGEKLKDNINPFVFSNLSTNDRFFIGIFSDQEFMIRIEHLIKKGFVELTKAIDLMRLQNSPQFLSLLLNNESIKLTVEGLDHLRNSENQTFSKNVFIAMAFTDNENQQVAAENRDTIKTVLENLGWLPTIVDEVQHNDGVMDKIIASINSSKFVIVDLTYQKTGVYYEAGYAKGKGLQVIHTVKKEDFVNCHFDVKHLNLIVWENIEDLRVRLEARIKATITK